MRTVDEVRLYFRDDRPTGSAYRATSAYQIQVLSGIAWTTVSGQVKTPATTRANDNNARFPAVSAQRMPVLVTHRPAPRPA